MGRKIEVNGNIPQNIKYSYDAESRLSSIDQGKYGKIIFTYEKDGSRSSISIPDLTVAKYRYDEDNRLTGIYIYDTESPESLLNELQSDQVENMKYSMEYLYDMHGNHIESKYGKNAQTVKYAYSLDNQLIEEESYGKSDEFIYKTSFIYDANGNRKESFEKERIVKYNYNNSSQLLEVAL